MTLQRFQRYLSKVQAKTAMLIHKSKDEPEYRRITIFSLILVVVTLILSPWLGVFLVIAGTWYLTY